MPVACLDCMACRQSCTNSFQNVLAFSIVSISSSFNRVKQSSMSFGQTLASWIVTVTMLRWSSVICWPMATGGLRAGVRWLKPACAQVRAIGRCQSQARCILGLGRSCCLRALHLNIWLDNNQKSRVLQGLGMTAVMMRTEQMRCLSDLWQVAVKSKGEIVIRGAMGRSDGGAKTAWGKKEDRNDVSRNDGNRRQAANVDCTLCCWITVSRSQFGSSKLVLVTLTDEAGLV